MAQRPAWNRIDKSNGQISATTEERARTAAASVFSGSPSVVLASGRFQTPYAIYAISAKITESEWNHGSMAPPSVGL